MKEVVKKKKKVKEEEKVKKKKKGEDAVAAQAHQKRKEKKVYDLPGQKRDPPVEVCYLLFMLTILPLPHFEF